MDDRAQQPVYVVEGASNALSTDTCILLFILLLIFLCMVMLAVMFCRLGSMETQMQMQSMQRMYATPIVPPPRSELFNPYL